MKCRVMGIDVGGTSVKIAALSMGQQPEVRAETHWEGHQNATPAEVVSVLGDKCAQLAAEAGWESFEALGLGLAGLVQADLGILKRAPNLRSWEGFPFVPALEEALERPVRAANDATAFAMAEWRWGAGRGVDNAVFLTLGTGIGGGLVSEGKLILGHAGLAGEPGHITLDRRGPPCSCGNVGCAEMYVGNAAIVAMARKHPALSREPGLSPLTPELLFEAAEAGNPEAVDVWNTVGADLGDLLATLTNLLNPERIIIGGGLSGAGEWLLDPARVRLEERSLVTQVSPPQIVTAALGSYGGVIGAAGLWAQEEFIQVR